MRQSDTAPSRAALCLLGRLKLLCGEQRLEREPWDEASDCPVLTTGLCPSSLSAGKQQKLGWKLCNLFGN